MRQYLRELDSEANNGAFQCLLCWLLQLLLSQGSAGAALLAFHILHSAPQPVSPVALGWTEAVVFRALCSGRCLGLPWSVQIPRQQGLKLCLLRIYWLLPQWLSAIKASFNATPKESSQPSVLGGSEPLAAARCGAGHRRCSVFLPRPQDGSKPAETSQPQSSTTGYSQPSLGYGQSNYSYPQVPASYPMQPVTAPPSYPPTR